MNIYNVLNKIVDADKQVLTPFTVQAGEVKTAKILQK